VLTFLAERRAWPVEWALAVAIPVALVNNFFWNWIFTFRSLQTPSLETRAGTPAGNKSLSGTFAALSTTYSPHPRARS